MSDYDDKGRLTHSGATRIIQGGGAVTIDGKLYASVDKLPNEAEMVAIHKRVTRTAHERAVATIQSGGTAIFEGKSYSKIEDLPSETDLVRGDAKGEAEVRKRLQQQRANLDAQLASLPASEKK